MFFFRSVSHPDSYLAVGSSGQLTLAPKPLKENASFTFVGVGNGSYVRIFPLDKEGTYVTSSGSQGQVALRQDDLSDAFLDASSWRVDVLKDIEFVESSHTVGSWIADVWGHPGKINIEYPVGLVLFSARGDSDFDPNSSPVGSDSYYYHAVRQMFLSKVEYTQALPLSNRWWKHHTVANSFMMEDHSRHLYCLQRILTVTTSRGEELTFYVDHVRLTPNPYSPGFARINPV